MYVLVLCDLFVKEELLLLRYTITTVNKSSANCNAHSELALLATSNKS